MYFGRQHFYPRPPRGRTTGDRAEAARRGANFYPRPPRGRTTAKPTSEPRRGANFYPRPPRGRTTAKPTSEPRRGANFYPRPPRGRTTTAHRICTLGGSISIRVLREGGRPEARTAPPEEGKFLSASSAREDDLVRIKHIQHRGDFYPRPPRGRTTFFTLQLDFLIAISIRVLREGGRRSARSTAVPACGIFLSASSAREDDEAEREAQRRDRRISIRVLREGGRQHSTDKPFEVNIISIRVLREGGRPSFSTYTSP